MSEQKNHSNTSAISCFEKHLEAWKNNGKTTDFSFLHEEVVYTFPYDPNEKLRTIRGKKNVIDFIKTVSPGGRNWHFEIDAYYPGAQEEILWMEFRGGAITSKGSKTYRQQYCGLIKLQDEKIILYREYWNPDNLRKAFE